MKNNSFLIVFTAAVFAFSCTKLEEDLRGQLPNESSSVNAEGLLKSAYLSANQPIADVGLLWGLQEVTSDEAIAPTRGPDWDDNGAWRSLQAHTWDADHSTVRDAYRRLLQIQFAASSVLEKSPTPQQAAEARFIRALSTFYVLDGWDQVPFRSDLVDLTKDPETLQGTGAVDFIISELNAILNDLPDGPAIKANKDAARALLMKVYLNKGVYANRGAPAFDPADMNQVISLADQIIGSGKYGFTANFFDTFAPDNYTNASKSKELIFALENTNGVTTWGDNVCRWYCVLHYNQNPGGWNGFATLSDFYDKYEAADKRRDDSYTGVTDVSGIRMGYMIGQQYNQSGVALKDRLGSPLIFTRNVKIQESGTDLEVTGIRPMKYAIDYVKSFPAENEFVVLRYSDVLLMKAEALLRSGGSAADALTIVNSIRTKVNASALGAVTLNDILDERGRELSWEGWRRNDQIRFGTYLQAWQEKAASGPERLLFPIPNEQLSVNPNLSQNPGYN